MVCCHHFFMQMLRSFVLISWNSSQLQLFLCEAKKYACIWLEITQLLCNYSTPLICLEWSKMPFRLNRKNYVTKSNAIYWTVLTNQSSDNHFSVCRFDQCWTNSPALLCSRVRPQQNNDHQFINLRFVWINNSATLTIYLFVGRRTRSSNHVHELETCAHFVRHNGTNTERNPLHCQWSIIVLYLF